MNPGAQSAGTKFKFEVQGLTLKTAIITIWMWLCASVSAVGLVACAQTPIATGVITQATAESRITPTVATTVIPTETAMAFELTSPAFEEGGVIPRDFACTGANTSPQLDWTEPPDGTQSFALIFNDPDASSRGFVHWIVYNIPADARNMPAGVPPGLQIHDTAVHGSNGWGRLDYGGPCPPKGSTHGYVFTLYTLDTILNLEPGATKDELLGAMDGHVLAEASLSATFSR